MPELIDLNRRETVDLHAPWWSSEQTPDGRYKERVVIYKEMAEADSQWIEKQVVSNIKMNSASRKDVSMSELRSTRILHFLRLIVEITNTVGNPLFSPTDRPDIREGVFKRLPERDAKWIMDQIAERNEPAVDVLEEDEEEAQRNAERGLDDAEAISPVAIAERHFRKRG